jgi:hypothetical protein
MNFLITFLIFILILFLYIHINDQYKKSEDLEIYEMDYTSNVELQKICNIKQPVIFEFEKIYPNFFSEIIQFKKYENNDIQVKDVLDYWNPNVLSVDPIILSTSSFRTLVKSDPKSHFFMENNQPFLEESGIASQIGELDEYLKPSFNIHSKYDLIIGSANCVTPMRFHTDYRRFYVVTSGKISVKMASWRSRKYLHPIIDYDNYEFFSKMNVWISETTISETKTKSTSETTISETTISETTTSETTTKTGETTTKTNERNDLNKIKFVEFDVHTGYVLYIPPYWWYSIKLHQDAEVVSVSYQTLVNVMSNISDISQYYLRSTMATIQ